MHSTDRSYLTPGIVLVTVIGSVLVSIWSVHADPIINIDGTLYIQAARAFADGDPGLALSLYKWPAYPYLIHLIHATTGLGLIVSAHLLNAVFNVLTCLVFLLLVSALGGTQRTVVVAAVVIVLFPGLNEVRSYIIRDHGYIFFYLAALLLLVKAVQVRSIAPLAASMACMVAAILFRIEGIVFLIAIPLIYWYSFAQFESTSRLRRLLPVAMAAFVLVPVFGWWFYSPEEGSREIAFSLDNVGSGWTNAYEALQTKIDTLKTEVINTSSSTVARLVFLWSVLGIIGAQVLVILSIPYSALGVYAFRKELVFPEPLGARPWKLFVVCNMAILVLFTLTWFFLTDRYPLALVVTLLATVPFALDHLLERWQSYPRKTFWVYAGYGSLVLILLVNCAEGLTSYSKKHYLRNAGEWLHAHAVPGSRLFTNDPIIAFYSGLDKDKVTLIEERDELLAKFYRGKWIDHDYVALQLSKDMDLEHHLKKTLWVPVERVFVSPRNEEVRVYSVKKFRHRKD